MTGIFRPNGLSSRTLLHHLAKQQDFIRAAWDKHSKLGLYGNCLAVCLKGSQVCFYEWRLFFFFFCFVAPAGPSCPNKGRSRQVVCPFTFQVCPSSLFSHVSSAQEIFIMLLEKRNVHLFHWSHLTSFWEWDVSEAATGLLNPHCTSNVHNSFSFSGIWLCWAVRCFTCRDMFFS